jgi:hypothetical protein
MKAYQFTIIVTNEGQQVYYDTISINAPDIKTAKTLATIRENDIVNGLNGLLPNGTWECDISRA